MSRDGRPEGHKSPDHTSTAEFALGEKRVAGPPPAAGPGAGHSAASETVTDQAVDEIAGPAAPAGVTAVDGDPVIRASAPPPPPLTPPTPPSADPHTAVERADPGRTAVEETAEDPMRADRPVDAHDDTAVMPQGAGSGETHETLVEAAARKPDGESAGTAEFTWENSARAGAGAGGEAGADGWIAPPGPGPGPGTGFSNGPGTGPGTGSGAPFTEAHTQVQAHGSPGLSVPSAPGYQPRPAGPGPRTGRNRRAVLVIAAVAATVLAGLAAAGILLWPDPRSSTGRSPGAEATPTAVPQGGGVTSPESGEPGGQVGIEPGGTPAPVPPGGPSPGATDAGGTPGTDPANAAGPAQAPAEVPAGPLRSGDDVTYQLMQKDEGYFEGTFTITNPGREPMSSWTLTFSVKGANVRNVWGGRLARGGETATIANLPGAAAVPPGGSVEVRFGADGPPNEPATCEINRKSCGF